MLFEYAIFARLRISKKQHKEKAQNKDKQRVRAQCIAYAEHERRGEEGDAELLLVALEVGALDHVLLAGQGVQQREREARARVPASNTSQSRRAYAYDLRWMSQTRAAPFKQSQRVRHGERGAAGARLRLDHLVAAELDALRERLELRLEQCWPEKNLKGFYMC